jgi:diguanylate cyclase (GGDEF)-like protein/PAS domain S-box-containing protein
VCFLCARRKHELSRESEWGISVRQTQPDSKKYPGSGQVAAPGARIFESELDSQQLEIVYTQAPVAVSAAYAAAVLLTFSLWGQVEHTLLLLWLGAQTLHTVARLWLVHKYRSATPENKKNARRSNLFLAGARVSGIVWGCIGLFFQFSWPLVYQTLVLMSLAGVLAAAISSYAAMLPVYIAFMVPAILIPAQSMLLHSNILSDNLGLLLMLFAGVLVVFARNYNNSVIQTLQLREENKSLLQKTAANNMALENEADSRQSAQDQLLRERQLFTEGPVTVFRWAATADRSIEYVSEAVAQFGYDSRELVEGRLSYIDIIHPNDVQRYTESEKERGEQGVQFTAIDYRLLCHDGAVRWVYDYTVPLRDEAGTLTHYAGYILDITERKQNEYELNQAREHAQVTLHSIADAVITTDMNGQIEYLNPSAAKLTGWDSKIARGLPIQRIFCLFNVDSREEVEDPIRQCLACGEPVQVNKDVSLKRHDGESFSIQYSASPILADSGSALGVILVIHDVTETRMMEREISYQSTHDALTGLINRNEFEARLGFAIESTRQAAESHVVCQLDIDKLKIINDTLCHEAGDDMIKSVATALQGCLRDSDVLGRIGGDEFGILLKNCTLSAATEVVSSMLAAIREVGFSSYDRSYDVCASIGLVPVTVATESLAHVMSQVDIACYAAKDSGGDRFRIYEPGDESLVRRHDEMKWVVRLNEAIKSDRLTLYYQDIVPVKPDVTAGRHFEVLVRMLDAEGNIVAPDMFLPAAERYNLIVSLDRWVVSHSFSWYAGHAIVEMQEVDTISINLSGASVTDAGFLNFIKNQMSVHEVPPGIICFEITETAAIANMQAATAFINDLKSLGCRFALDDFGSGLSSFSYLKNLPVDYLKIDGSFVRDMETDAVDCAMVNSIHQLGKVIGTKTIAEFVENDGILAKLAEIGVDYAQGYGISIPQPLHDMAFDKKQLA